MAKRRSLRLLAAAGLTAAISTAAGQALAQPDLIPQLSNPMNASVGVQNIGTTAAPASHLTINCTKFGQVDGGCPEAPGMGAYVDPAFPNRVVVDVPALAPGESFSHDLAFWNALPWTPGTYVFDAEVDAGNVVAETNETNNATQSSYTQLPAVGVAPPAPLPLKAKTAKPPRPNPVVRRAALQPRKPAAPQRLAPEQPKEPKRRLLPLPN